MNSSQFKISFSLFILASIIMYFAIPNGYNYNSDVFISPYGLALGQGYAELPYTLSKGLTGYINNGIFCKYTNWPPVGFIILGAWMKLFGSDILNARILFLIINSINVVLFYKILIRCNVHVKVAIFSSILFTILPYHLIYGTLVFADSWLLFFWMCCLLSYTYKKYKYIFLPLISIIGLFFVWYTIFILIAFIVVEIFDKFSQNKKQQLLILLGFSIIILAIEYLFISQFPEHSLLQRLKKYSFLGLAEYFSMPIIRRLVGLCIEFLSLVILVLYYLKLKKGQFKLKPNGLKKIILIIGLALFFYLLTFPTWFIIHTHQLIMFDIFIAAGVAFFLNELDILDNKLKKWSVSLTAICIGFYFIIPPLSSPHSDLKITDSEIVNYINNKKQNDQKICVFFNLPSRTNVDQICNKFVIRSLCNTYLFENNHTVVPPFKTIKSGMRKLKKLPEISFNNEKAFFVSEKSGQIPIQFIEDSIILERLYVYNLNLPKK